MVFEYKPKHESPITNSLASASPTIRHHEKVGFYQSPPFLGLIAIMSQQNSLPTATFARLTIGLTNLYPRINSINLEPFKFVIS